MSLVQGPGLRAALDLQGSVHLWTSAGVSSLRPGLFCLVTPSRRVLGGVWGSGWIPEAPGTWRQVGGRSRCRVVDLPGERCQLTLGPHCTPALQKCMGKHRVGACSLGQRWVGIADLVKHGRQKGAQGASDALATPVWQAQ